jgi:hypothetical protein
VHGPRLQGAQDQRPDLAAPDARPTRTAASERLAEPERHVARPMVRSAVTTATRAEARRSVGAKALAEAGSMHVLH